MTARLRLVSGPPPKPEELAVLVESDLAWPEGLPDPLPPAAQRRFQVVCPNCHEVYSWSPDLDLADAQCSKCQAIYDASFGDFVA